MPAKSPRSQSTDGAITILAFGDIVGRIGRRAVAGLLPDLVAKHQPDLILANVENLAHGKGVTRSTLKEMSDAGIQCFTSGNHIWKKDEGVQMLQDDAIPLLRPANYPPGTPGIGERVFTIGARRLVVLNLQGRVFMQDHVDDPFRAFDAVWAKYASEKLAGFIVDFHAEATSEKVAFGWYVAGRASAVLGTHTHVPTADAWVLPGGTAYLTDLGMSGPQESVIGVDKDVIIRGFLAQRPVEHTIPEHGQAVVNAAVIQIHPGTARATSIQGIQQTITI